MGSKFLSTNKFKRRIFLVENKSSGVDDVSFNIIKKLLWGA